MIAFELLHDFPDRHFVIQKMPKEIGSKPQGKQIWNLCFSTDESAESRIPGRFHEPPFFRADGCLTSVKEDEAHGAGMLCIMPHVHPELCS